MYDSSGRQIEYVRISVTDRCDLRCIYCMPENGIALARHEDILSYEEILRIVRLLTALGIRKVRLTGGEPLVRKGLPSLVERIKRIEGIERVYLTTNGVLLSEQLPDLAAAGLDGVNISINAVDEDVYGRMTRRSGVEKVLRSVDDALSYKTITVKINCVPTEINRTQIIPMTQRFLSDSRLSLRFIEMMPIGLGRTVGGISPDEVKKMLTEAFGKLTPLPGEDLSGPCSYYALGSGLSGKVGFISAVSDCFCQNCNRVRLTSTGFFKTCLQYDKGVELRPLLAGSDSEVLSAMRAAVWNKPQHHVFGESAPADIERHVMSQIGG